MKTLKFIIPRTAASITALVDSLNSELTELDNEIAAPTKTTTAAPGPAAVDTSKTDDAGGEQDNTNVVQLNTATAGNMVVVAPGEKATGAAGIVEVDADGIPWDARIHGSSKSTLKKGGTWKLARGTDPALVETVIAELKATMAAPGASETEEDDVTTSAPAPAAKTAAPAPAPSAPAPAPAPEPEVAADPIYIVEGSGEFTAEQLTASGWTDEQIEGLPVKQVEAVAPSADAKTFPELMAAVTAAGIDEATLLTAVQNQGLTATPLLAARPDLVPNVYAELFPA